MQQCSHENSACAPVSASTAAQSGESITQTIPNRYVRANRKTPLRYYTIKEVAEHCSKNDCWVICDGKVYNVTSWISRHPGGEMTILLVAGRDITDVFLVNHTPWVREKILPLYQIGYVADYHQVELSKDYCDLHIHLEASGFYQTSYIFYIQCMLWYTSLFWLSIGCIVFGKNQWIRCVLSAFSMGLFWQQIAFFGHDLGHMAVTHSRLIDNFIGILGGNVMMGIALGWWKATHNVHHVVTNFFEHDPDIQHLPVFAITSKFFQGIYSKYHERRFEFDALSRFLVRFQHILFYPVMFVARFNLCLQSILLLSDAKRAKRYGVHWPYLELMMLSGYYVWMSQLLRFFPTWSEAIWFLLLSHGFSGILHIQICVSHFPMEVLQPDIHGSPLEKIPFAEHQLKTSLDVDCLPSLDWFHGGLQFQATHHLFPLAPRHKLRQLAQDYVAHLCTKHNLTYHKVSFVKANYMIYQTLKSTVDQLHPWFAAMLNCKG